MKQESKGDRELLQLGERILLPLILSTCLGIVATYFFASLRLPGSYKYVESCPSTVHFSYHREAHEDMLW